ncbi:MAG: Calx-beta domain-containing protein, partial [Phormidesmis sp.]
LPTVALSNVTFSGNTAADSGTDPTPNTITSGTDLNTEDLFGKTIALTSDVTAPILSSITRQSPLSSSTDADSLVFRATFNESVKNVDATDFIAAATTAAISVNAISLSVYDITLSGGDLADLNGTVGLDLAIGQDITDLAGNALPAGEPATDETYILSNIPPILSTVEFSTDTFVVSEGAGTSNSVTLIRTGDTIGTSTVQVSITGGTATGGTDYNSNSFPLTVVFNPNETSKTVEIPITDDSLAEGNETIVLSVADISNATIGSQATATLTITDNDSPGFTLSRNSATVSESGTTEQFILTLNTQPLSDVVFNIVSSDPGEAIAAPTSVMLNSANWNTGVSVIITGVDDTEVDGDQISTLTISVDADKSDDAFDSLSPQTISVTTLDDDTPGPGPSPKSGQLTPRAESKVLEVTSLGTANSLKLQLEQVGINSVSDLLVFSTDALGNSRTQIGSFSLLKGGQLPAAYAPDFTLNSSDIAEGKFLQFELVQNGVTQTATAKLGQDGQVELDFGDGTRLLAALTSQTSTTNLLRDDAATIDLTDITDPLSIEFMVYREAAFNNTVGLYRTDDASGGIKDITGNLINPGQAGYKEAALARQLDVRLTGQNGQVSSFSANVAGGGFLSTFLIVDGANPAASEVYFGHMGANSDGNDHAKMLGNNTFGFEDMAGLGDRDFNDVVVKFAVV